VSLDPLHLDNISLAAPFGAGHLLDRISFQLAPGDRLGILGASGAGKTLLLRLCNRLSDPTDGTIRWGDRDLRTLDPVSLRQAIALVPSSAKFLNPTVRETLTYPLTLQNIPPAQIQTRLDGWIDRLQLPQEWLDRSEFQLSTGQRHAIAIARALILQPQILLLDDPAPAFESELGSSLQHVLTQMTQTGELAILLSDRRIDLARRFCNRIAALRQGKLDPPIDATTAEWTAWQQTLAQAELDLRQEWGD
jgi:D-methionine transport system ATP-binding protein